MALDLGGLRSGSLDPSGAPWWRVLNTAGVVLNSVLEAKWLLEPATRCLLTARCVHHYEPWVDGVSQGN